MNLQRSFVIVCNLALMLTACPAVSQSPQGRKILVPRGAAMKFSMIHPLSSSTAKVGDDVPLRLERPLVIDGVRLLEPGMIAHGRVTRVKREGPKCRGGRVDWKVDRVILGDATSVKTAIMGSAGPAWEPPEQYSSERMAGTAHKPMKHLFVWSEMVILSPLWVPLLLVDWGDEGGKCSQPGRPFLQPANSIVSVATTKGHHVRY